jgi:hypothetical protein
MFQSVWYIDELEDEYNNTDNRKYNLQDKYVIMLCYVYNFC